MKLCLEIIRSVLFIVNVYWKLCLINLLKCLEFVFIVGFYRVKKEVFLLDFNYWVYLIDIYVWIFGVLRVFEICNVLDVNVGYGRFGNCIINYLFSC